MALAVLVCTLCVYCDLYGVVSSKHTRLFKLINALTVNYKLKLFTTLVQGLGGALAGTNSTNLFWCNQNFCIVKAGKSYWRGRLSTVDLLVPTSLDQLLFISKILFTFFLKKKTIYPNEEVNCTEPSRSVILPWLKCFAPTDIFELKYCEP